MDEINNTWMRIVYAHRGYYHVVVVSIRKHNDGICDRYIILETDIDICANGRCMKARNVCLCMQNQKMFSQQLNKCCDSLSQFFFACPSFQFLAARSTRRMRYSSERSRHSGSQANVSRSSLDVRSCACRRASGSAEYLLSGTC